MREGTEAAKKMPTKPQPSQMPIPDNLIMSGENSHEGSKATVISYSEQTESEGGKHGNVEIAKEVEIGPCVHTQQCNTSLLLKKLTHLDTK